VIDGLKAGLSVNGPQGSFGVIGSAGSVSDLGLTSINPVGRFGNDCRWLGWRERREHHSRVCEGLSDCSGGVLGGLVGYNTGTITSSYAAVAVTAASGLWDKIGGLVGWNGVNGTVDQSHATGNVTAGSGVGNLGGLLDGTPD